MPFYTVKAKSYKGKKRGELVIGEFKEEFSKLFGKKVILIDDIADSGKTMLGVEKELKKIGVKVVQRIVIFKRFGCKCKCDFLNRIEKDIWVKFPWEKK